MIFWDSWSEYQLKATRSAAASFGLRLGEVELQKQPDYEGALLLLCRRASPALRLLARF